MIFQVEKDSSPFTDPHWQLDTLQLSPTSLPTLSTCRQRKFENNSILILILIKPTSSYSPGPITYLTIFLSLSHLLLNSSISNKHVEEKFRKNIGLENLLNDSFSEENH